MDPWNIRANDDRASDSLPTFIIFCEDEVSEPVYFKYFETALIKVNVIGGQRSKSEHVLKAITRCIDDELMTYDDKGELILKNQTSNIWCVFDRDIEENGDNRNLGNTQFNQSLIMAQTSGINVAWSNDSFELWVLLHFEEVDPEVGDAKQRQYYYDRLTTIFENLPNPNDDLIKVKAYAGFNYKSSLKSDRNFRNIVRLEMVKSTSNAISRSIELEEFHNRRLVPTHEMSPCTLVHKLVLSLIEQGRKDI